MLVLLLTAWPAQASAQVGVIPLDGRPPAAPVDDPGPVPSAPVDEEPQPEAPKITLLPQPRDAVNLALADIQLMETAAVASGVEFDATPFRYVWIPDGNSDDRAAVSFVLNSVVSHSDVNFVPGRQGSPIQYLAGGRLVRVNLLSLCPRNKGADFKRASRVWDDMFNPYFMLEEAKEEFDEITVTETVTVTERVKVSVPPYKHTDGKWYRAKWVDKEVEKEQTVTKRVPRESINVKVFGPHVDPDAASTLQAVTACSNPLVWCNTLYTNALTQKGGGSYYDFVGIRKATDEERERGLSDQDALLLSLGVSEDLIDNLRADQRAGMVTSNVTGKPRRIDVFDRPARTSNNQGLISITQDVLDDDYDPAADPLLNLLEFKVGGREMIFERNNGHLAYVLYDGQGNLVNEAPGELVSDHEIPRPHTKRLQPAISCIRCHGKPGDGGWKPFKNQVRENLADRFNVYDDEDGAEQGLDLPETLAKLARLYAGKLDKPIRRAREDHSDAIVECTSGSVTKEGLPLQFEDISSILTERFTSYYYTTVSPQTACRELGYEVEEGAAAVTLFNRLMGRLDPAIGIPIQREDHRMAFLLKGTPINRYQWELIYIDAARRESRMAPLLNLKKQ